MRPAVLSALPPALLVAAAALAQAGPSVERAGPARVHADPGTPVAAAFRVRNPLSSPAAALPTLPRGWPSLAPDAAAPLAPGESAVRLVATAVPRGAAAGAYVLRYTLRGDGAPATDSVVVTVRERHRVEAALDEAPRFAVAGAGCALVFRVANRGNARATLRLAAEAAGGSAARPEPAALELSPGEERTVRVTVSTRAAAAPLSLHVTLRAVPAADPAASASAGARVQVVPRSHAAAPAPHGLPVRVTLRARPGADAGGGFPGEVWASGPLRPGGPVRVDLVARGGGAAAPELGEQEQFSLAVRARRGELLLGDYFWSLSPLTAPGRYGSGAGGRVRAGPVWLQGFSERNRFAAGAERTSAAALGVGGERASLAVGYRFGGDTAAAAVTVRARARPVPGFGVDAELGSAPGAGGDGRAAYLHAFGGRTGFAFDVRGVRAGGTFPGEQRGRRLDQASLSLAPARGVRLHAAYGREERGDTLGPAPGGALLRSGSLSAGASLGGVLTVERREESSEREGAGGFWSRLARSWLATAGVRAGRASLSGGVESGTVEDRAAGGESRFGRLWARAAGSVGRQSLWASVERRVGPALDGTAGRERLSGAMGLALQPAADTRVSLSAQAAWAQEPDGILDAAVEQRLPGGHTLRLRARAFPWAGEGRRRPVVLLDYAVPLRVPLGRSTDAGAVAGRVLDQETGRPVADALVRIGDRVVATDARGRWAVAGLAPGTYTVELDPVSIGVGRVAVRPDALAVEVGGGRTRWVEVAVARGARLEGSLAVPDSAGGIEGVVVELRQGSERRRRVTGLAGRFAFADLAPGRWTLVVERAGLPAHHALERDSLELELEPGEAAEVALRALPRRREVRIVAGGDVVLNGPPAADGRAPAPAPAATPQPAGASAPPGRTAPQALSASPAAAFRPAVRAGRRAERPWRERGASGFSDWPNDGYVVQPGDASLEAIAWLVYRDGSLWPKLWLANRHLLPAPDALEPGMELVVPPFGPLTAEERATARGHRAARDDLPRG